jgi:hypothetical protein
MNTQRRVGNVVLGFLTALAMHVLASAARGDPPDPLIAIDVLVEPDATMIAAAQGVNARLREVYPDGYSLDESHAPHITLLQRYVLEQDLEKVTAAVAQVLQETDPLTLKMRSSGYMYVVWAGVALTGIAVERSPDLVQLHERITDAVAPFAVSSGTSAAFAQGPGLLRDQCRDNGLCRDVRAERQWCELRSACHRWCWPGKLCERAEGGGADALHVWSARRGHFPAWQLRYSAKASLGLGQAVSSLHDCSVVSSER